MKKILSVALVSIMLVASLLTLASCGKPKFEFELNEDGKGYTLVGMENAIGDIVVPSTYEDLPVTKIAEDAVHDKPRMTSIVLPESIIEIEGYAFADCSRLSNVSLGNLTTIEVILPLPEKAA